MEKYFWLRIFLIKNFTAGFCRESDWYRSGPRSETDRETPTQTCFLSNAWHYWFQNFFLILMKLNTLLWMESFPFFLLYSRLFSAWVHLLSRSSLVICHFFFYKVLFFFHWILIVSLKKSNFQTHTEYPKKWNNSPPKNNNKKSTEKWLKTFSE